MDLTRRHLLRNLASGAVAAPALACLGRWHRRHPGDVEAFLRAVRKGDLAAVRVALADHPELAAACDADGRSAYLLAKLEGHDAIAELLRAQGLELDVVEAVLGEDWDRVEALIQADPSLGEAVHPIGGTPLYAMALAGLNEGWRLRMHGNEANLAPAGGSGWTPARAAMECRSLDGARVAATDMLGNGGDANAPQRGGDSVLHGAVSRRSEILVRLAIRKGADVEARDERGRTAQDLAAELEWADGVALLRNHATIPRDHRASRFARDANGNPVVRADLTDVPLERQREVTGSSHFDLERVKELIEADPRLVWSISGDDELAIEACAHTGNAPIIRLHLDHGAPLSLPTAVSVGDQAGVQRLLKHDPLLVHERGAHDFPVMWYTLLGGGSVEMAELLHDAGVGVDQESMGVTTLHWCVVREERDLAQWLIEQGADVAAVGFKWSGAGQTPRQLAEQRGASEMVQLLRAVGG